jgi:hypothetical protein
VTRESFHLSIRIECPFEEAHAFSSDPANMQQWAAGLSGGARTPRRWRMGRPWSRRCRRDRGALPAMTDEQLATEGAAVEKDLATLKRVLEER